MSQDSLDRVLHVLESEARAAELAYRAGLENHESLVHQLTQLHNYYQEYAERRRENGATRILEINNLNLFLGSIQNAITGQQQKVDVSAETTENLKDVWLDRLRREKSVRTLIENRKARQRYIQGRVDQKITDEIASLIVNSR